MLYGKGKTAIALLAADGDCRHVRSHLLSSDGMTSNPGISSDRGPALMLTVNPSLKHRRMREVCPVLQILNSNCPSMFALRVLSCSGPPSTITPGGQLLYWAEDTPRHSLSSGTLGLVLALGSALSGGSRRVSRATPWEAPWLCIHSHVSRRHPSASPDDSTYAQALDSAITLPTGV